MKKLISYNQTPQITGLEYDEMFDLAKHPEKLDQYKEIVAIRTGRDRAGMDSRMVRLAK